MVSRREFIAGAAAAAAAGVAAGAKSAGVKPAGAPEKLILSEPALQNAAETSMCVAFETPGGASGWVEYSESPGMSGALRAYSGEGPLMDIDGPAARIRIRGLKPDTKYWYRIGADRISYKGGYKMKNLGPERGKSVYSFSTLGPSAQGSFCVINDTHDRYPALGPVLSKVAEIKPRATIWNGDASNTSEAVADAIRIFLRPHPGHLAYAACTPYMFINGNHDFRGRFNRRLHEVVMFRDPAERSGRFACLGRNFAQRLGDIALIGMDTGEDKLDTNPAFAGIFKMREYRELQTEWLAETIETAPVKTARHKVVFCHIPLFDPRPGENPGDLAPADTAPGYALNYAAWQRTCARMWSPYFEKAGVKLVIAAHQHCFRYDPPAPGRSWAQVIGGGCDASGKDPASYPTVIEGRSEGGRLKITVHNVVSGRKAFEKFF